MADVSPEPERLVGNRYPESPRRETVGDVRTPGPLGGPRPLGADFCFREVAGARSDAAPPKRQKPTQRGGGPSMGVWDGAGNYRFTIIR
jgi:hypothetical protein